MVEFLGGEPLTREYSDDIAAWANEVFEAEGIGLMAVERRADGAFLGMCGLHHLEAYPDDVEVGWRLAHEYWGQGYATEAANAWLTHAFGPMDLPRVISVTDPPNVRSLAVMHRLGMVYDHEAEIEDDGERFDAVIHSVTPDRFRQRVDEPPCDCLVTGPLAGR